MNTDESKELIYACERAADALEALVTFARAICVAALTDSGAGTLSAEGRRAFENVLKDAK